MMTMMIKRTIMMTMTFEVGRQHTGRPVRYRQQANHIKAAGRRRKWRSWLALQEEGNRTSIGSLSGKVEVKF
jgi:hypothetical protein